MHVRLQNIVGLLYVFGVSQFTILDMYVKLSFSILKNYIEFDWIMIEITVTCYLLKKLHTLIVSHVVSLKEARCF